MEWSDEYIYTWVDSRLAVSFHCWVHEVLIEEEL